MERSFAGRRPTRRLSDSRGASRQEHNASSQRPARSDRKAPVLLQCALSGSPGGSARIPSPGRKQGARLTPTCAALRHPGSGAAVDADTLAIGGRSSSQRSAAGRRCSSSQAVVSWTPPRRSHLAQSASCRLCRDREHSPRPGPPPWPNRDSWPHAHDSGSHACLRDCARGVGRRALTHEQDDTAHQNKDQEEQEPDEVEN